MDIEIPKYLQYRQDILEESRDENGFVQQNLVLREVLPLMLDAKRVDSEDYNETYFLLESKDIKINAYSVNESGERLQIFLVDDESIDETSEKDDLLVSQRVVYETQFKKVIRFIMMSIGKDLKDHMQDSDPAKALASHLNSSDGLKQFDVIEIFFVSLTATVSFKGVEPQPRSIRIPEDTIQVDYEEEGKEVIKEILLLREVVDLNFLYNVFASRGNREPLEVNFDKTFGYSLEVLKAAEEKHFRSYLGVFSADTLADLYKRYSSRLLEKNVRSFLQFKGANKGLKETIKNEPEKFIAYNNGLTITATKAKIVEHKRKLYIESLSDLQIVNGGQTTASIYFSRKDGLDISKVKIMAKINIIDESDSIDDLTSNISKYSNTQSRVSNVDLRSRSPQLVKLKLLSESVITPKGDKWFFERVKGDFNTKVRIAGSSSARLKREHPIERRFTKEQLAKYFSAWGVIPHLVKKGGEKIFRHFIESISPEDGKKMVTIDRDFYERLIAQIILFRSYEKIYGQGKYSMGQLRSVVIPYTLAVLYTYTDKSSTRGDFDLAAIWKSGGLQEDLKEYSKSLLLLVNDLVKKYSASEDYGEYAKKEELWISINKCEEVRQFMKSDHSEKIFAKYTN